MRVVILLVAMMFLQLEYDVEIAEVFYKPLSLVVVWAMITDVYSVRGN